MSKIKSELIMRGEFFSLFLLQSWFLSNLSCDIPCYLFPADRLYIEDGNGWWSEKWIPKAAFFLMATRRQHLRLGGEKQNPLAVFCLLPHPCFHGGNKNTKVTMCLLSDNVTALYL